MRIRWSGPARRDLREVRDYIARDSKANAQRMVAKIKKAVARLGRFPEAGWVMEEYPNQGLREIVVGNYRVIYAIIQKIVRILAVHHGSQRLPQAGDLFGDD